MSSNLPSVRTEPTLADIRMDSEKYPRLYAVGSAHAVTELSKIVADAFLYKGQTADPANVKFIATALREELLRDSAYGLRYITMEEIRRTVRKAVLTADDFFINVSSLYKVLLSYARKEGRAADAEANALLKARKAAGATAPAVDNIFNKYATQLTKRQ